MSRPAPAAGRLFLAVFLAGLLWRALLAFVAVPAWEARSGVASTPDAYPVLAASLVERGSFGYGDVGANPTTVRGPGFPLWLAASVLVGLDDRRWLAFWGGLPGILAGAWLAGWCTRRWGILAGAVAGAVAVMHPLPGLIASRAMGDDFYGALGLAACALCCASVDAAQGRRAPWLAAGAGAALALQMLARASGLLTLIVVALSWQRLKGRALPAALLFGIALAPPLLWSVRTSGLEGRAVFVHSLAAYNFWVGEGLHRFGPGDPPSGNYPRAVRFALDRAGPDFADDRFWYAGLEPRRAAELERRLSSAAVGRVTSDPAGYAGRVIKGVGSYWFGAQTRTRSLQYAALVLPVLLLAGFGVRRALQEPLGRMLLATLLLHNLATAAMLPAARMSVQVYPALACLAAAGAATLLEMFGRLRGGGAR